MTTATRPRRRVLDDPAIFHRFVGASTYDKQDEMMDSVFRNQRTAVSGANGTGKDFEAARIALAWLSCYQLAKVIVIAPTHRQVDEVFWNEMRAAFDSKTVGEDWGFRILPRSPRIESLNNPYERFGVGFATADPARSETAIPTGRGLQGYHSPNLLAIISEAHGVHQAHIDVIRRLNPRSFLMTGNPFVASGEFYDAFHSKRDLYHTINISAFDTPNLAPDAPEEGYPQFPGMVTKIDVAAREEDWGEESALYKAGVLGIFPDNLEDMVVVPLYAVTAAAKRESEAHGKVVLAVDVARFGKDKTIGIRRQGAVARIVYTKQGQDTMGTAGWIVAYCRDNDVDECIIDTVGIGSGVYDRVREVGIPGTRLVSFIGGSAPHVNHNDKTTFTNAIAQCWWGMRLWAMSDDADISNDQALIGQMSSRGYSIQSDAKIKLQSKEDMVKSPDEADALAMTFYSGPRSGVRIIDY